MTRLDFLCGLMVVTAVLSTTSCQTAAKKEAAYIAPEVKTSPLHSDPSLWKKAVTQVGQNESAVFSTGGDKILFISRDRLSHKQRQLYELDLTSKTERRLTFQDGEVLEAVYSPYDASIFYTSTTDEIKERPQLFFPDTKTQLWPLTELYHIRGDDELHERWTNSSGFDGFPFVGLDPNRVPTITISRRVGENLVLLRSGLKNPQFEPVLDRPGHFLHSFTTHDREAWRAWIEENSKSRTSKIILSRRGQKQNELMTGFFEIRNLHLWAAKDDRGLSSESTKDNDVHFLFTAKTSLDGPRQAYWVRLAQACAMTFDLGPGQVTSLELSPDQRQIMWTLSQGSSAQIFIDDFVQPTSLCRPL